MPPTLETDRLLLRIGPTELAGAYARYTNRNYERLRHAGPLDETLRTEAAWGPKIELAMKLADAGTAFRFVVSLKSEPGEVVGMVAISDVIRSVLQGCNLGFSVDSAHEGTGVMREAAEAVIAFAFGELNLHRISAGYQPWNVRSGGLLRKLGFELEGHARQHVFIDGDWRDSVLVARVNPLWKRTI